jgi:hypothetical protein
MPEDPKTGEQETREHMGRADQPPAFEPTTPEGLLGPEALKQYLEAAGLPELESIARTPDQLGAVQLAQQIRIAEALERIADAQERIASVLGATARPRSASEQPKPGPLVPPRTPYPAPGPYSEPADDLFVTEEGPGSSPAGSDR